MTSKNHPLALYIHWPFCKSKCPYCDFNSHVREGVDQAAWREAMLTELRWTAKQLPNRYLTSIFFGGGTPSLMPPDTVAVLIDEAKKLFPPKTPATKDSLYRATRGAQAGGLGAAPPFKQKMRDNLHNIGCSATEQGEARSGGFGGSAPIQKIEITLEANPTSVEAANFKQLAEAGVNRVSLGVQSLTAESLAFLGRTHSPNEALKAVQLAGKYFDRYSFDLIYALPNQTVNDWRTELKEALTYADSHLSLYQLTIEENTAFHHAYHHQHAFVLPDDDNAALMYEVTQEVMENAGLPAYEISNHAKPGQESQHNLTYWLGHEYAGIGPGAHGRIQSNNLLDNSSDTPPTEQGEARSGGFGGSAPIQEKKLQGKAHSGEPSGSAPIQNRCATETIKSPERWLSAVQENEHGLLPITQLTKREQAEEWLMMRTRLVRPIGYHEFPFSDAQQKLKSYAEQELIDLNDQHAKITLKGRLVLSSLISELTELITDS